MATKVRAPIIHASFVSCVSYIRSRLGEANVGGFTFTISASGRTMTDRSEVKIEYNLSDNDWSSHNSVKGNSLEAVVDEMLRRHGWNSTHAPLALPGTDEEEDY